MADPPHLDDLVAVLPPLLRAVEVLGFVGRYLNPFHLQGVLAAVGTPEEPLQAVRPRLDGWPDDLAHARAALQTAADAALTAFAELRQAGGGGESDMMTAFRAMRQVPRALEALYPLARDLPPVSRFFLDPALREDDALVARLASADVRDDTGVIHVDNAPGSKGGYSVYVPEYYTPDRAWPVVFALHGGSGHGRSFLWSWLRDARSRGAILVSPSSTGPTWALNGPDTDTPNLARMLAHVRDRWNVDGTRMLLTGMSDGGTFSYVSGLEDGSPFTHLAPIAAAFHPMLVQFAEPARMQGLPIFVVHGKLDWMFPVEMARQADSFLAKSGAAVRYLEIDDLSHTYPREANAEILAWLMETQPR